MDRTDNNSLPLEALLRALDDGLFIVDFSGTVMCALQARRHAATGAIVALEAVLERSAVRHSLSGPRRRAADERMADIDKLTDREREVLELICEGRDDTGMSAALGLSPNTVRNHIAALYRKIRVNRRSGAVIWARERGIVCSSGSPTKARAVPQRTNDGSSQRTD